MSRSDPHSGCHFLHSEHEREEYPEIVAKRKRYGLQNDVSATNKARIVGAQSGSASYWYKSP